MRAFVNSAIVLLLTLPVTRGSRPFRERHLKAKLAPLRSAIDGAQTLADTGRRHADARDESKMATRKSFQLAVQRAVKKEVGKEMEKKMKFFPGMSSVEQLLAWNTTVAGPRMGPAKELPQLRAGPRIMSMHDMAGGYSELSDNDYLMMFRSWKLVDLFVYFSHVRISVPPLQWTAMAHEHRRPALGTLILEANEQSADAARLIERRRSEVITKLVQVADHYGFDGWFINIEGGSFSKGDPEDLVAELKEAMHRKLGTRSLVIAYPYGPEDSMFASADGVFMNYNWPSDDASMRRLAESAGNRTHDVYMGTDAFGSKRGNTQPDSQHVKACASHNLSLAVFAPGYTLQQEANSTYSRKAVDLDYRFWSGIGESFGARAKTV